MELHQVLTERKQADPDSSYVASLYEGGLDAILQKVGEEAVETILAAKSAESEQSAQALVHETADLWFHTLVMLAHLGQSPKQVLDELAKRFNVSGLAEKASRHLKT